MTIPNATETALLRSRPQQTRLWLSIYQPDTVFACRVNGSYIKGDRLINYDSVTTGSYSLVESGFVAYIGTTLGGDEKGKLRVRSVSASQFTFAENSHINWADNDYITVVRFVEITPIFTRTVSAGGEMAFTFYKDYDIAYTNQNSILGVLFNMGCDFAGFRDDAGNCQVYYSASGTSHVVDGTTLTYSWFFQGATTTGSSSQTPGYIIYTAPGHYLTRLTVTGNNGSSDVSYRTVSIYDRPNKGTSWPILDWTISDLSGSRDMGGYKTRIKIRSQVPKSIVKDGALAIIFADDWYDATQQSIGGNSPNRSSIRFVGYILNGSIEYDYKSGSIEFDVGSPSEVMRNCESFSVSVESKSSPSTWYELLNMNCKKAIYHQLKWQSTVLMCKDVQFVGTDQNIQFFDADRTSLYDSIQTFMNGTLYGNAVCDRQGKLWCEVSYETLSSGSSLQSNISLTKSDWMSIPTFDERETLDTSFIEMGGVHYDGPAAGTSQAYLCDAPGATPAYQGKADQVQGLAVTDQASLNSIAGNVFAHRNSRYASIDLALGGNYTNFDIAPQEIISFTIASGDTPRQIVFNLKPFVLTNFIYAYDAGKQIAVTRLTLAECAAGIGADTILIPATPPTDGGGGPGTGPGTTTTPFGAPSTGTVFSLPIYHNDVFVGNAEALNFLDDGYTSTGTFT